MLKEPTGKYGKDAYYFPHDSNAKDDPKILILIEQLGLEGYGIFWVLLEILREQPEYKYPLAAVPGLARRYSTTMEKIKQVITGYNLFVIDNDMFFSESFSRRMSVIDSHRKTLSEYGKKGRQLQLSGVARGWPGGGPGKERKEKKRKEKESKVNNIPSVEEFLDYAVSKKPNVNKQAVELKYHAWIENDWKIGGKNQRPINNWKTTLLNTLPYIAEEKNGGPEKSKIEQTLDAHQQALNNMGLNGVQ